MLASILPFWVSPLLALTDWPHHLASAHLLERYGDGVERFYALTATPRPYMGLALLLRALGAALSIPVAGKVVLSLYAAALALATRALVRAAGRDPLLAWFGPLFVHAWSLAYGFVPYVLALPPALLAVAWWRRALDEQGHLRPTAALLCQVVAALFHPVGWAVSVVASAPLVARQPGRGRKLAFASGALGVALWIATASVWSESAGLRHMDEQIETSWRFTIKHRLVDFVLAYLPGNLDYAVAALGVGALVLAVVLGRRRGPRDPMELAFWALAITYVLAPFSLSAFGLRMTLLAPRLLQPAWLLALPLARGRIATPLAALGAIAALGHAGLLAHTHHTFGARWQGQVEAAVRAAPRGARVRPEVSPIQGSVLNPATVRPPEAALHAYVLFGRADYDPLLFSTPQSPVAIRATAPAIDDAAAFDVRWVQTSTGIVVVPGGPRTGR
ncbi:MAG: hypothetical protein H6730_10550 [Deltaproteobacteria bacterium]|nr:hypothetical protein [Deltaproteobacteria bacterium]